MSDSTPIIIKKVKGHGGHAHHGGSWKVAYADFVTAMMAFFMVMWIMGLSDDTRAQIQGYFNDPLGFKHNEPNSKSVVAPKSAPGSRASKSAGASSKGKGIIEVKDEDKLKSIQRKIEDAMTKDAQLKSFLKDVEMQMTQDGLRIELVESTDAAFFDSGSATLKPTAFKVIDHIAPILRKQQRDFIVEGHTDSVPYPSPTYTNWDLSSDRANALRRALFGAGMDPKHLTGVRALADTQLKDPDHPTSYKNRRVTILLPFKTEKRFASGLPKDDLAKPNLPTTPDVAVAPTLKP